MDIPEQTNRYFTEPWRKARICARLFLNPRFTECPRYRRIATLLMKDSSVTNRLIDQAMAQLRGRAKERARAN